MQDQKLHETIVDVIKTSDKALSVNNIAEIIKKHDLWKRPKDGNHPNATQISARVANYPQLFLRKDGVVHLVSGKPNVDVRLFRLTWNKNGWEQPSGHTWKKANQGNSDIAFENQYGFGGEEWLLNSRYQLDGYQYGYIRGVENLAESVNYIDKVYLFTIDQETSSRFLLGSISGLEIIRNDKAKKRTAIKLYNKYTNDVIEELQLVNADLKGIDIENFYPTVRFKIENNNLFEHPIIIPGLKGRKYNRFQPYKVTADLQKVIDGVVPKKLFKFNGGISKSTKKFTRTNVFGTKTTIRLHSNITDTLVDYLKPDYTSKLNNISVEKTYFGENICDVVLKNYDKTYSLIEVKTSSNARRNIREAMGQLIDYAFWHDELIIKELVIVSPCSLTSEEQIYFKKIQQNFEVNLHYWQYRVESNGKETINILL